MHDFVGIGLAVESLPDNSLPQGPSRFTLICEGLFFMEIALFVGSFSGGGRASHDNFS
jgi:hypothetical protein